jgi:hypothetical protein
MSLSRQTDQGPSDQTALTPALETTFLERLQKGRAYWLPEVRQALEMLEIAEENAGFEHVCVTEKAA